MLPDVSWGRSEASGRLILPDFIDMHVHSAQLDVIASYGAGLPDRLARYTFAPRAALRVARWRKEVRHAGCSFRGTRAHARLLP